MRNWDNVIRIRNRDSLQLGNKDFEHTTVEIGYENDYSKMKER